jgi:hypothetical protein
MNPIAFYAPSSGKLFLESARLHPMGEMLDSIRACGWSIRPIGFSSRPIAQAGTSHHVPPLLYAFESNTTMVKGGYFPALGNK